MTTHTDLDAQRVRCCGPFPCGMTVNPSGISVVDNRYCIGSACMAWRWAAEFIEPKRRGRLYPVNRGYYEPPPEGADQFTRGAWVDKWEETPRLPACKDWVRVEIPEDEREADDGLCPHYWEETQEQADARYNAAVEARRGYCGYARRPRHD